MKNRNRNRNKLSLDKIKIAKLNNARAIVGGSFSDIQQGTVNLQSTDTLSIADSIMTSTKTGAIGGSTTTVHHTDI